MDMNYRDAVKWLDSRVNYEKLCASKRHGFKLDNIKKLLLLLGDPQDKFHSIIISGTKGKGSTTALIASILEDAGLKAGMYISPHLVSVRERIRIGERLISEQDLAGLLSLVRRTVDRNRLIPVTYFEALTALAFLYFARSKVDIAVLEVGMGGRLDATNTACPGVAVLSPISLDHTRILGNSIDKIAEEKCGIIKEGARVVSAPQEKEALRAIRSACRKNNARLVVVGDGLKYKNIDISLSGTSFDIATASGGYKGLKTRLVGAHQAINSAAAIGAVLASSEAFGFKIKPDNIRHGLLNADFPGRFDLVSNRPYVILDGAQNMASASALKKALDGCLGRTKTILVLGISADKDMESIARVLCPSADAVIFTKADTPRAHAPGELAARLGSFCKEYYTAEDAGDALLFAKEFAGRDGAVVVTGSLFLVGDILRSENISSAGSV